MPALFLSSMAYVWYWLLDDSTVVGSVCNELARLLWLNSAGAARTSWLMDVGVCGIGATLFGLAANGVTGGGAYAGGGLDGTE